nr:TRBV5.2 [Sphenodon punctatus]
MDTMTNVSGTRQKGGQELQLLFYFNNKVLLNKGKCSMSRFTSDQPQLDHSSLTISSAKPEDSAVYFCASSPGGLADDSLLWSKGTRLTVLDHVNLTWSVDGDERTKGVKTKEPDLDEAAKKFSLISRLRITRKEWEKTKEIQCNVYFDPDKRNYTGTIRGQVCDGSDALKEPYLRSNNLGKLIYILLIFKSTLYGAFITGLMLRKKSMKEKPFA